MDGGYAVGISALLCHFILGHFIRRRSNMPENACCAFTSKSPQPQRESPSGDFVNVISVKKWSSHNVWALSDSKHGSFHGILDDGWCIPARLHRSFNLMRDARDASARSAPWMPIWTNRHLTNTLSKPNPSIYMGIHMIIAGTQSSTRSE